MGLMPHFETFRPLTFLISCLLSWAFFYVMAKRLKPESPAALSSFLIALGIALFSQISSAAYSSLWRLFRINHVTSSVFILVLLQFLILFALLFFIFKKRHGQSTQKSLIFSFLAFVAIQVINVISVILDGFLLLLLIYIMMLLGMGKM